MVLSCEVNSSPFGGVIHTFILIHSVSLPTITLASRSPAPLAASVLISDPFQAAPLAPLKAMSAEMQEAFILEDLLYIMMGVPGYYITFKPSPKIPLEHSAELHGPEFTISSGLDPAIREATLSVLKMARNYIAISKFLDIYSQTEYGTISHALCSSIRTLISEYLVLVAQLEHQFFVNTTFTLQSLNQHARATAHSLAVIYDLVQDFVPKVGDDERDSDEDNMKDILEQLKNGTVGSSGFTSLSSVKKLKGGAILELLTVRLEALSGDPIARRILGHLLKEASIPYTHMLNLWMHHGLVQDPYEEFLIREQSSFNKEGLKEDYTGVYWDKRYTIRRHDVPSQLESIKEKILLAGKYLNVVRECSDLDVVKTSDQRQAADFEDEDFLASVNRAYAHANSSLLSLLLTKHEFRLRMISMKYYFFLSNSDFFTGFQYHASAELSKPSKSINKSKLQSLLDINIQIPGTVAGNDKFNHDVRIDLAREGLFETLGRISSVTGLNEESRKTGIWTETRTLTSDHDAGELVGFNSLQLDYSVPFPLSLVLNRMAIFSYQLLFRHLFSLRHTERSLNDGWIELNKMSMWRDRSVSRPIELWKQRVWTLRARMSGFISQITYYCTNEVLDPRFAQFMATLETAQTVDELMRIHEQFLDTCHKECMLTNQGLLRLYVKILTMCQAFASWCTRLSRYLEAADTALARQPIVPRVNGSSRDQRFVKRVRKPKVEGKIDDETIKTMSEKLEQYEKAFERTVKVLLDNLNYIASTETISLLVLSSRLDWNKGFRDDADDV